MKILVISWSVYPSPSGTANVLRNLSRNFTIDEMIICGERPNFKISHYVDRDLGNIKYVSKEITWPKRGRRFVRWTRWFFFPLCLFKILFLARREKPTVILAPFPDEFYLLCAFIVGRILKIPILLWFHNTYLENRKGFKYLFAKLLQPKVIKCAKKVLVISDGLKNYYNNNYIGLKTSTLLHPFEVPKIKLKFKCTGNTIIKLGFIGNLNESCIDSMSRICGAVVNNKEFELNIFSGTPKWFFEKEGMIGSNVVYHGFLPLEEFRSGLQKCDICLLPHGFVGGLSDIEYSTIFPTRTLDLLSSGVPILAHVKEDTFLYQFLSENKCAEIVSSIKKEDILRHIKYLFKDKNKCESLVRNAWIAVNKFEMKLVSDNLRKIVDEL